MNFIQARMGRSLMTHAANPQPSSPIDYSKPEKECDLVMKGGVTSGIVYPPVVLKLASTYRFRNIGGTSAGAIAAAATAAAELGRDKDGFKKLEQLDQQLGSCLISAPNGKCEVTFLQNLFQPTQKAKPVFDIALSLFTDWQSFQQTRPTKIKLLGWITRVLRENHGKVFQQGANLGLIIVLVLIIVLLVISFVAFSLFGGQPNPLGLAILLLLYGLPLGLLARPIGGGIKTLFSLGNILQQEVVRENGFGLCTGMSGATSTSQGKALTDWLHEDVLNELADKPLTEPLTFGDLKAKSITLQMVTSNLSHNQPYILPFNQPIFIFQEQEFRKLFPDEVVEYLIQTSPSVGIDFEDNQFHFLPIGDEMPVIVATRMSLSFPILFSAIPLYTIKASQSAAKIIRAEDLQRNWFSDGGISSNFPIHFFDAWLPSRPTFGINLTTWKDNQKGIIKDEGSEETELAAPSLEQYSYIPLTPQSKSRKRSVNLARADDEIEPLWQNLDNKLLAFLGAIFATAQNYRDTMQTMLPSYRERIVEINLKDKEGGLNLEMPPELINKLKDLGTEAGKVLLEEFQFPHHRWVRLKLMMGLLEGQLNTIPNIIDRQNLNYQEFLQNQKDKEFPYSEKNLAWIIDAITQLQELEALIRQWQQRKQQNSQFGFEHKSPLDEPDRPILRVTPEL
ncbi:patatin-like phospholipase family protein [Pleurocapsales cyanobacterium LEGE 06147]|nr:patatin-like phospholipase family protein [Pleurocapsales cyanobacterium LEGE 06147]